MTDQSQGASHGETGRDGGETSMGLLGPIFVPGQATGETGQLDRHQDGPEQVPAEAQDGLAETSAVPQAMGAGYVRDGIGPKARQVVMYLMLASVILAVAAMSFSGLFTYATGQLHWTHGHSLLVPISLDLAAVVSYAFALDRIAKGETGIQFRLIALVLVTYSAFVNWSGAVTSGNFSEEVLFPSMSVLVYWLAHAVLSAVRRDVRMAQYGHKAKERPEPLPDFGWLAWVPGVGAPWKAVKVIRMDIQARLQVVEARVEARVAVRLAELPAVLTMETDETEAETVAEAEVPVPVVQSHVSLSVEAVPSQSDAIRLAVEAVQRLAPGQEVAVRDVVKYLASHDRPGVLTQRVNTVMARDRERQQLRLVKSQGGTEGDAGETGETPQVPGSETTDGAAAS